MAFANIESVSEEIIKRLGLYLQTKMTSLNDMLLEFPDANLAIDYPALSVSQAGNMVFTPEMSPYPYEPIEAGDITDHKADVKYVAGQYNCVLQLDIWCRNKEERDDLFEEFFRGFNSQFPIMGLTLNLTDYYDILCRYDIRDVSKEDSEISSQRKEWRVKIAIMANCKAIYGKDDEYIVEETQVQGEIGSTSEPI